MKAVTLALTVGAAAAAQWSIFTPTLTLATDNSCNMTAMAFTGTFHSEGESCIDIPGAFATYASVQFDSCTDNGATYSLCSQPCAAAAACDGPSITAPQYMCTPVAGQYVFASCGAKPGYTTNGVIIGFAVTLGVMAGLLFVIWVVRDMRHKKKAVVDVESGDYQSLPGGH